MIECPKCKSKNITIVTVTNSEKKTPEIVSMLILFSWIVFIFSIVAVFGLIANSSEAFDKLLDATFFSSYGLELSGSIASDFVFLKIAFSVLKWSFLSSIFLTLVSILSPYRTYSKTKCVCHDCEEIWDYQKKAPAEETENEIETHND